MLKTVTLIIRVRKHRQILRKTFVHIFKHATWFLTLVDLNQSYASQICWWTGHFALSSLSMPSKQMQQKAFPQILTPLKIKLLSFFWNMHLWDVGMLLSQISQGTEVNCPLLFLTKITGSFSRWCVNVLVSLQTTVLFTSVCTWCSSLSELLSMKEILVDNSYIWVNLDTVSAIPILACDMILHMITLFY